MVMYPATRPRCPDPLEVSEWIYADPSFRMRDVYECHPKEDPRQEHLAFWWRLISEFRLAQILK
jgi:hypothetical protein